MDNELSCFNLLVEFRRAETPEGGEPRRDSGLILVKSDVWQGLDPSIDGVTTPDFNTYAGWHLEWDHGWDHAKRI